MRAPTLRSGVTIRSEMAFIFSRAFSALLNGCTALSFTVLENLCKSLIDSCTCKKEDEKGNIACVCIYIFIYMDAFTIVTFNNIVCIYMYGCVQYSNV